MLGNDKKDRSVQKWKLTGLQQERPVQVIEVEAHRLTLKTYLTDEEGYHMVLSLTVPNKPYSNERVSLSVPFLVHLNVVKS